MGDARVIVYYCAKNLCDYDWINLAKNNPRKEEFCHAIGERTLVWFYNDVVRKLVGNTRKPIFANNAKLGRMYWNLYTMNQDELSEEGFKFPEYFMESSDISMPGPLWDSIFLWSVVNGFAGSLKTPFDADDAEVWSKRTRSLPLLFLLHLNRFRQCSRQSVLMAQIWLQSMRKSQQTWDS